MGNEMSILCENCDWTEGYQYIVIISQKKLSLNYLGPTIENFIVAILV